MTKSTIIYCLNQSENARLNEDELNLIYSEFKFIEDKATDTQGFMHVENDKIVIAFRGTQQIKDWLTDFNAFHTVFPYGNSKSDIMVHKGFITAYKSVRSKVHEYINDHIAEIKDIIICGHSLGGALAILCAVDVQYHHGRLNVSCYPSGNPMVGNKAFCKSYNKRVPNTWRTYMRRDIVPLCPPKWFEKYTAGGYHACGIKNPIGPWNILTGLFNWIKRRFKSDNIAADLTNHSMKLYKKYSRK